MNLDGTELVQVVGHKLGVQQGVATLFKASDQVDEGYFAGVSDSAEHALAKEAPPIATPYSPPTS